MFGKAIPPPLHLGTNFPLGEPPDFPQNTHFCLKVTQFGCAVVSNSFRPHGWQHARFPCPSPTPEAYSNSCLSCQRCHTIISSTVIPFSSCLPSFLPSGSFPMSQFFASGGQSIGISASTSVLPMNIQDGFPSGWTGWITLQCKRLENLLQHQS